MLNLSEFETLVKRVPNHGTDRHAHALYGLIRWLQPASVVEVGACHGYTTCWMARAVQDNNRDLGQESRMVVIDDYSLMKDAYFAFWHNVGLTQVGDLIDVAPVNSRAADWPERVDFAYIDADHSYEGCKHDIEKAISLGAKCIALHDTTTWWGPRQYIEGHLPDGWTEISVAFDQGFSVMMKKPQKPSECVFCQERFPEGHI